MTPKLKVRGIKNLWIADVSMMSNMVNGNIKAACMMIGEKLARQLIKERKLSVSCAGT